jgi:hypothetical protein
MRELFNLIFNQNDIDWLKKVFGIKPKEQPTKDFVGVVHQAYEPIVLKSSRKREDLGLRIQHLPPSYIEEEIKKEIIIDLMTQLHSNPDLVQYRTDGDTLQATLIIQKPKNERPIETHATSSYHFDSYSRKR